MSSLQASLNRYHHMVGFSHGSPTGKKNRWEGRTCSAKNHRSPSNHHIINKKTLPRLNCQHRSGIHVLSTHHATTCRSHPSNTNSSTPKGLTSLRTPGTES